MITYGQKESDLGNMELRARLARAYRDGKGVEEDMGKAAMLMRDAAYQGVFWAKWEYFDLLWDIGTSESLDEMIILAKREADQGNMELRARLAKAYYHGRGVQKDCEIAANLLRAVLPGKPLWARWLFLDILMSMHTLEADSEAFEYANSILNEGDREREARIARMYRDGRGTEKDLDKAISFMHSAAEKNLGWARDEYFDIVWKSNVYEFDKDAFETVKLFAEKCDGNAMGYLARFYRDGRGTEKDLDKAEEWMKRAQEKKVPWAAKELYEITYQKQELPGGGFDNKTKQKQIMYKQGLINEFKGIFRRRL